MARPTHFLAEADPSDTEYRQRHAAEMIEGFRLLSLLLFASMAVSLLVHMVGPGVVETGRHDGPSAAASALLAGAGGIALLASRSVRSARTAFLATAALLVASVAVATVDCVQQCARVERPANSLVPILLSVLVLSAALLPLRPSRMLGLGLLLLATSGVAARLTSSTSQINFVEAAGGIIVVAVSVFTSARSTSDRIRLHQAHASAINAQHQADTARERALLSEGAVAMERLAASLSHELNTPIGVLRSATETLVRAVQREQSPARGSHSRAEMVEELLKSIGASTTRLTETVWPHSTICKP